MSDVIETPAQAAKRTKGESLVASYRAQRLAQRPALQLELRAAREALRQQRAARIAKPEPPFCMAPTIQPPNVPDHTAATVQEHEPHEADASVFAMYVGKAVEAVSPSQPLAPPAGLNEPPPQETGPAEAKHATPVPPAAEQAAPLEAGGTNSPAQTCAPMEEPTPPASLPLSDIGFGPGMIIRLSQLGITSIADMAAADPTALRNALGDISRLVNVENWIASARKASSGQAERK
jgi:predicted flap endonuclease-1-like 5' DNA nuclease